MSEDEPLQTGPCPSEQQSQSSLNDTSEPSQQSQVREEVHYTESSFVTSKTHDPPNKSENEVTDKPRAKVGELPLEWTKMGTAKGTTQHIYYPSDVQDYIPEDTSQSLYIVGTHGRKITHMGKDLWKTCAYKTMDTLVLRSHLISVMEGLDGFQSLKTLELYDNQISILENLNNTQQEQSLEESSDTTSGLTGRTLNVLDMSFNVIRDMAPVQFCPNLVELYLANNKIKEIKGLQSLTKLRKLDLGANRIRQIPIQEFSGPLSDTLEELWLGKNKIEFIEGLDNLKKLRRLDIQSNRLTRIQNLYSQNDTLEELYLADNAIDDQGAEYLCTLTLLNLTTVDMSKNRLTSTEPFSHLLGLDDLWLSSNQIATFENVAPLSASNQGTQPMLDGIYLEFNPVADEFEYRKKLKEMIPSLTTIDGVLIAGGGIRPSTGGMSPFSLEQQMLQYQEQSIARARAETELKQQAQV